MKKILIGLLGILPLLYTACSSGKTQPETIVTVKTDTVRVYGQELSVSFPGKIKAAADVNLAFRVSGTLLRVPVEAGTYVRKGQLLAEIDPRDYEIQLSATEAEYKQIKGEAERIIDLYQKQSIAPNDYEKAVYGLQQITAKYNAHKNALQDTRLYAPFNGYIQKRLFDAEETISAGYPVISMINTGSPEVEINIPSSEYMRRQEFNEYTCAVDIFPEVSFPLELIGITQKANMNQLYTMRLRLKEISGQSFPTAGMTATVTLNYKEKESMLTVIPLSALFGDNEHSAVWVYNKEKQSVSARIVKPLEVKTNGTVVISEGLNAGEIIVTAGANSLKEGQSVELLPAVSSTNIGGLL
ncbi:RND family efflux transporter MFP subunit [Parabacteroides sp. PF5-5]|uniref:efflux RND transporter periplasmic adaptor subunit n=1 Tax=unclassified Parabacteroides TaxID=2649774 RepID=UPI002472EADE|nr:MULTISPECIES: efflux RND transporter periplasmic adaptor subunit [unclassified Parabacteroides]MDH6305686.1 RND family efflux transporter MFP subunit [Parabacteroides sp. PH5-39]MDH6316758.1 RND family efflux transporter MFP subunit [Parabacteroides sp. PF5-13]MDH6320399.1 RND family efflux transporter MFP subunit [Parabacteroides sp. PH5-13]MDH6324129.1 RND family efflux transporter MFP subunit [Parabacteroides sp. PH5-8]MDH6327944.1 RND family efflux transporter MFP subunit [Parabacteroid